MKILFVSTQDNRGGAAVVAMRFAKELIDQGHEVIFYVRKKTSNYAWVVESKKLKIFWKSRQFVDRLISVCFSLDFNALFSTGFFGEGFEEIIESFKPDVINIHWINKSFLSIRDIINIPKEIPVVLHLHDWWYFTEGTFLSSSYPRAFINDVQLPKLPLRKVGLINGIVFNYKKKLAERESLYIISPSKFLLEYARKSKILGNKEIFHLPNPTEFIPVNLRSVEQIRDEFGLEQGKKYILFGAVNIKGNPIKGGDLLFNALKDIENYLIENNIGLVAYGSSNPFGGFDLDSRIEQKYIGYISVFSKMLEIHKATDVYCHPSRIENMSLQLIEALSVGSPCVAFDVGGNSEVLQGSGIEVVVANNYKLYGKRIIKYLESNPKVERMIKSVKRKYDVVNLSKNLVKILKKIV